MGWGLRWSLGWGKSARLDAQDSHRCEHRSNKAPRSNNPPVATAGGATISSFSWSSTQQISDTIVNQTLDTFQTEFIGQLQGGPVLFDQIFSVPFGDPSLSSVDSQIEAVLTSDASGALSF